MHVCVRILSLLLLLQPPPTKYYPSSQTSLSRRRITMGSASSIRTSVKGGGRVGGVDGWMDVWWWYLWYNGEGAAASQPAHLLEFISTGRKEEGVFNKF